MNPVLLALALIQDPASTQQSLPDSTRVAITRGKGGRIEGMLMSSGRVRGVRFDKAGNR